MIYIRNHVKYARKIGVEVGIETHFVGSIVTKSKPKGQVWAGVPAHFVCTIEEYREKMLKQRKDINWKDYWEDKERELKRVFEII